MRKHEDQPQQPRAVEAEGITLGNGAGSGQGGAVNAALKAHPPLLIDPNILTDIGPTDRKTEVKHQLSRAGGRKGVETLGPIQTQDITMTSKVFDDLSSTTLNRRTAASGDFVGNLLTNPKLEAEVSNLGTVPNPPEGVQDRDRSRMLDGDGTVVRFKICQAWEEWPFWLDAFAPERVRRSPNAVPTSRRKQWQGREGERLWNPTNRQGGQSRAVFERWK